MVNVDSTSAFFETVSLDGETILTERYSIDNENLTTSQLQEFHGLLVVEEPNPVIHKFRGMISRRNTDFVELNDRNFAMRGSVLRNTNFVIGIVVYVGTDTKAH